MNDIFQVQASISSIKTMFKGLRLTVDTQDMLLPEQMQRLFELHGEDRVGWFLFAIRQIEAGDLLTLPDAPEIKPSEGKSQSQILRAVMYLSWQNDNRGHKAFENYYNERMEKLIDIVKKELPK